MATSVNRVKLDSTTYRCGKSGTRWYPGNLVTGVSGSAGRGRAWFANSISQIQQLQKGRQTAATRASIQAVRDAFPSAVSKRCSLFNSSAISGRKLVLKLVALKNKKALILKKKAPASRRAHSAEFGDNSDSLLVLTAQNALAAAVTSGSANISTVFHSPTGDVVVVFASPAILTGAASDVGCALGKVAAATGTVTCLLDSTRLWSFSQVGAEWLGYWDQPIVRFDTAGNVYVSSAYAPGSDTEHLYKIDTAGNVSDLLATLEPKCQQRMIVLGSGDIYLDEMPTDGAGACTGNLDIVHITPSGEIQTLCDGTNADRMDRCFYYTFGETSDGGVLMGGNKDSIERLSPTSTSIPAQSWLAPAMSDPAPVHSYEDAGCAGIGGSCYGGYFAYASLMPDGGTIGVSGVYAGNFTGHGYISSLMQFFPTVKKLNLPDVTAPLFAKRLNATDKYAVAGLSKNTGNCFFDPFLATDLATSTYPCDADEQLAIYDKSLNDDKSVTLPYNMGIYDLQSSGDGKTLYVAAKRASDGQFVFGRVDVATAKLTITSESPTALSGFLAF